MSSTSKAGYEPLAPPEYADAIKESVPPYSKSESDLENADENEPRPFATGLVDCFGDPTMGMF